MSDSPETDSIRGLAIDETALATYLTGRVPELVPPISVRRFAGGQSNPTYRIDSQRRSFVLRRQPPGPLLASAHAVDREFRVLAALGRMNTIPVPRVYLYCDDHEVIGTPFYIMDLVVGRNFWDARLPEVPLEQRRACYRSMIEVLAGLHGADTEALGLGDYGRPGNYFQRQIQRWTRQYQESPDAGRVPAMEALIEWLPVNIPANDEVSIVHGDYRCDNMIFHPEEPRVVAVLDWELSTLGHPLADLGYHLLPYRMPTLGVTGMLGTDFATHGLPTEGEYVAWYCELTGREQIEQLDFYVAFSLFRLAAIFHGIRGRLIRGTSVSSRAREYASVVDEVADLALAQVG
ncbi:MAG: phosphotransferase family protein [Gammaproteobacteria bacterium]|nr:MAG: phosphotransferase family protein [Gammaproteobacteria bacterium]